MMIAKKSKYCLVKTLLCIKLQYATSGEVYFEGSIVELLYFVQRRNAIIYDYEQLLPTIRDPSKFVTHLEYIVSVEEKGEKIVNTVKTIYDLVNLIDWSNPIAQVVFVSGPFYDSSSICNKKWYEYYGIVFAYRTGRYDWVFRDSIPDTWIEVKPGTDQWCSPEYYHNSIITTLITINSGTDEWCPCSYRQYNKIIL